MTDTIIPLVIRGRVIEDDLVEFGARGGGLRFLAPDPTKYLDQLVLTDPAQLSDLYALSMADILDYLEELGPRLELDRNPWLQQAVQMKGQSSHHTPEMMVGQLRAMPRLLRREAMLEVIENNIGLEYLEGWVEHRMADRTVAVRAFGARAVHAIAGNGSVIALQTIMNNAFTRGDAIIKIPSNDPFFATAVARTMIDMAPNHPLTRHVSVAYWKGGDRAVESFLYDGKHIEKIVAWGGFDSMRSIREYLAPGLDLVALDPKLSASIIGAEAFASEEAMAEAAERAARDIGYFNQGGCVSARTLYVVTGEDDAGLKRANAFGKAVFEAIQALPSHLSTPHPHFDQDLKAEIDGIRYGEDFRVIGGRAAEGAIIVSQQDELVDFSDRLDCRVANVVPVSSVQAALRHLTIHTQTIGIYPDSLRREIRDECSLRGGQRIVPLGFATAGNFAGPHDAIEPLRRMVRWIRDDSLERISGTLFAD